MVGYGTRDDAFHRWNNIMSVDSHKGFETGGRRHFGSSKFFAHFRVSFISIDQLLQFRTIFFVIGPDFQPPRISHH